jgi:hypothetical protein
VFINCSSRLADPSGSRRKRIHGVAPGLPGITKRSEAGAFATDLKPSSFADTAHPQAQQAHPCIKAAGNRQPGASLIRSTDRYYGFPIKPLAHLFSSFEEGNGSLCDRDDGASTRVAPRARSLGLGRKRSETPQPLQPSAPQVLVASLMVRPASQNRPPWPATLASVSIPN